MLPDLSSGEHILHFYASAITPDFGLFTQDITYIINDPPGAVPLPPSAFLLGTGFLGLGAVGWRWKQV